MASESRGTAVAQNSGSPITVTGVANPGPQSYVLVAVAIAGNTSPVTGITGGTGTFVLAAAINTAGSLRRLELWVGYNFGNSAPSSIVVTRATTGVNTAAVVRTIDVSYNTTSAPTFTASTGNAATSTAPDTGSLTPAVGDILFAADLVATGVPTSTARLHTGNSYLQNTGAAFSNVRVETGWCEAAAAVPSSEVWTVTSVEWAAIQVKWTPPAAPAPTSAILLKGMTTQALDAASSY
jgi:hypothetical protein